ncbi:hypothetical protein [Paludisphaera rhizosphaerae]|uniref:hypothetical protein n=1 Tax=Paludisphaera rhizosphaerae TaxID=2711216 RepID=UPI0013EA2F97|nr:hypothetical protein [Paludisphaera rhizosphaerae]
MPLVSFLDDPPSDRRVFEWLCSCVGELLCQLGKATPEVEAAISLARHQAVEVVDRDELERLAWHFWSRRSAENTEFTAVAQLLFAISRADRSRPALFASACSTPICLLESLEDYPSQVFDRVMSHFETYVSLEG